MTGAPSFDEVFAVMSAASVGDMEARVPVPDDAPLDDTATRMALAVNVLLDDLAFKAAEAAAAHEANRIELKRLVAERTRELADANLELQAFSYSVSHDLRAPLRSISGFSDALLEDYAHKLDARGFEYLQRIVAATRRMGELIDQLLILSRVTRAEMVREKVDLSALSFEIAEELKRNEKGRDVRFTVTGELAAVADPKLLRAVLENLIGNSWKFTSKHATANVEVGVADAGRERAFYVKDDGAGFDMRYSDKLFTAFQRLHGETEFRGTGIGLATVQRIVRRHGGRVWAEGEVEKGATFYFTIPDRRE